MIRLRNLLPSSNRTAPPADADIALICQNLNRGTSDFEVFLDLARALLWEKGTPRADLQKLVTGIDTALAAGGLSANNRIVTQLYRSMAKWRLDGIFTIPFANLTEARIQFWETEYYCPLSAYQIEYVKAGQERFPSINLFSGMVRIFNTIGPVQSDFRDIRKSEIVTCLRPGATRTIIGFSALNQNPLGIGWATFERAIAGPLNANLIILKDFQKRLYLAGVKSIGDYGKTIDHLGELVDEYSDTQVTFMGCSGGTFAALNFASQIGVEHVVGLSGPNSLAIGEGSEDKRVYSQVSQDAAAGRLPYPDLIAQLKTSKVRRFDYFISEFHEFDMAQFRNARDNLDIVVPHLYPANTHSMTDLAIEDGGLLRAFTEPLDNTVAVAAGGVTGLKAVKGRAVLSCHIGHGSARTDAVQRLLAIGAVQVDGSHVLYPAKLAHNYLRAHIDTCLKTGKPLPSQGDRLGFGDLRAALEDSPARHAVLSAPGFENLVPENFRKAVSDQLGPAASRIQVFGWLLPHADRLLSLYAAGIRNGSIAGGLAAFHRDPATAQQLQIAAQMAPWSKTFGDALRLVLQPTGHTTEAGAARDFMAGIAGLDHEVTVTGGETPLRPVAVEDLAIVAHLHKLLRNRGQNVGPGFSLMLDNILRKRPRPGKLTPLRLDRQLAETLHAECIEDARRLDRTWFGQAPVFVPALDAAVDQAVPKPQSLELADHLDPDAIGTIEILAEAMLELLGRQHEPWPQFFREHAIKDLHGVKGLGGRRNAAGNLQGKPAKRAKIR